jgi:hypothetical protein
MLNKMSKFSSRWCGQLIEDTRINLQSFQSWFVGHVRKEGNEAAYLLAQINSFLSRFRTGLDGE